MRVTRYSVFLVTLTLTSVKSSPVQTFAPWEPAPTESYLLHDVLDHLGNYHVFWKFNSTHITLEIHVNTSGYVGFGFSPNGKMYPSDVVIGWMKDGISHFSDRHTVGHSQPLVDDSQDYHLLHMEENDNGTMLKFTRPLVTCDGNDTDIVDDTMRIIFSYHPDDPVDENSLQWHGADRRGAKSMLLLSTSEQNPLPDDAQTKDFIHHKFHIPTKRTTYQCRVLSLEEVKTKHHMVKFEAVIQKGHEPYVHHMNVYKCKNYPRKYIGTNFECYTGADLSRYPCGNVVAGWAVGSGPFNFPTNVGLPIGENEHEYAYIIEIHYNNPGFVSGLIDSSGIRFTYTSHLRQHDSGILTIGGYENRQQIIPPHYKNFTARVELPEQVITQALTNASLDEVKLFGLWQHAHLIGRGITTRHYHGDTELTPIAVDNHYDFDFQETRMLKNEISLRKGDTIQVDCTYDSTGKDNLTFGGFSTSDEMCFSFIYYYPRLPFHMLLQATLYDTIPGHNKLSSTFIDWVNHETIVNEFVASMETYDWSNKTVRDQFQVDFLNSTVTSLLYWQKSGVSVVKSVYRLKEPNFQKPAPSTNCKE